MIHFQVAELYFLKPGIYSMPQSCLSYTVDTTICYTFDLIILGITSGVTKKTIILIYGHDFDILLIFQANDASNDFFISVILG